MCEKEIRIKYNMKRHLRTHLPGQINCVMCNQFFGSLEEKEDHMNTRHSIRHMCETCGVSFKRKSDLNAHIVKHESGYDQAESATVFKCTYKNCDKVFFRQANYHYHLNKHTGEKPFECEYCPKTFHSKYVKNDHEKMCQLGEGYKCDVCGREFQQRSGLHHHKQAEHVRSETGYTCEICSSSFKYLTGLIRHKKDKHQCIDTSQQTEAKEKATTVEIHLNPVPTKEFEIATQTSNAAVDIVTEIVTDELCRSHTIEPEVHTQISEILDASSSVIMTTVANPLPEENAELDVGRVIVVHHMPDCLPDHLQGLTD